VDEDPDRVRVAPDDIELAGAQQGHVAEPELPGRQRRERAAQVPGRGEDDRYQLIVLHAVAFEQRGQQLTGPAHHGLGRVGVDRGCPAQRDQPLVAHRPDLCRHCFIDIAVDRHVDKSICRLIVLLPCRGS
jgi:hypothetical protein